MKIPVHTSSYIIAILCWLLVSVLAIFIFGSLRDRARLIRDNDNERLLNLIFTELRDYEDPGSAIEGNPILHERITGFALYDEDLRRNFCWGTAPMVFNEEMLKNQEKSRFNRYTVPDRKGDRVKFVLHIERIMPNPRGHSELERQRRTKPQDFFLNNFNIPAMGKYLYIDIAHPAYWRTQTLTALLFPLCEVILLVMVFHIRHLYLRNREYRERIEAQKNLVVLGTAASTLAHEIKNPLLSIRLQTGILRKLFPDKGQEEMGIIDEEVERLSVLIYRVNDYLREAEGAQVPLNSADLITETARRLCGRDILRRDSSRDVMIFMDPSRARSVFENVLRNALEAGGDEEAVEASITRSSGSALISIFDRGTGIPAGDLKRVFDPFFTRKSTGTGIGLSISKRFVEAVKGSIKVEPREAGGTLVRITLPEWIPDTLNFCVDKGN